MQKCLDSLLSAGGDSVEILIVNDGSKDATQEIAQDYVRRYPSIVRAISQENGGHGEAINTGLKHAQGLYLKVIDSDDWVDTAAYYRILSTLQGFCDAAEPVDLVISNFVYEKSGARHKKVMGYQRVLPEGKILSWNEIRPFPLGKYLLMHSLIYRTQVLRDCKLQLPKHTFYVDNLFAYIPLEQVKTLYYINVDFYRYFIGREDQSVNESVMIKRIDQQLAVNKLMIRHKSLQAIENPQLREQMYHQIEIITAVSNILVLRSASKENLDKTAELWDYIRNHDQDLYRRLRRSFLGIMTNLPGRLGRRLSVGMYRISQKVFGFN